MTPPAGIAFARQVLTRGMIEKVPPEWCVTDAYERVLNQGVTLPAGDRLGPITMERGPSHDQLVIAVVSVETYSEVHPLSDTQ
jgi:hypothetical protein